MKQYIKLLALACIIAALSGALMYVLFLIGFELQSCIIFAIFFVFVASEIVVDSGMLGCASYTIKNKTKKLMKIVLQSLACDVIILSQDSRTYSRCKGVQIPHTITDTYRKVVDTESIVIQPIKFIDTSKTREREKQIIIIRIQNQEDEVVIDDCIGNVSIRARIGKLSTRGVCEGCIITCWESKVLNFQHVGWPTITLKQYQCDGGFSVCFPGAIKVLSLDSASNRISISQFQCDASLKISSRIHHINIFTRKEANKPSHGSLEVVGHDMKFVTINQYADGINARFRSVDKCWLGTYTPGKIDLRVKHEIKQIDYHFIRRFYSRTLVTKPGEIWVNGEKIKEQLKKIMDALQQKIKVRLKELTKEIKQKDTDIEESRGRESRKDALAAYNELRVRYNELRDLVGDDPEFESFIVGYLEKY